MTIMRHMTGEDVTTIVRVTFSRAAAGGGNGRPGFLQRSIMRDLRKVFRRLPGSPGFAGLGKIGCADADVMLCCLILTCRTRRRTYDENSHHHRTCG